MANGRGWLIEWLKQEVFPDPSSVLWWHPEYGWIQNANVALRFARKEDAEAYIKEHSMYWAKSSEHIFVERV